METKSYTKAEAKAEAIKIAKGRPMFIGDIVAHENHPYACELLRYEGKDAVCHDSHNEVRFPRDEIFSPKLVINIGNHLLNMGFWEEGMESCILHICQ